MPMPRIKINLEYFLDRTELNPVNGCWEWTRRLDHKGYAHAKVWGKPVGAHRVSYAFFVEPIPAGMNICHKCDNPKCVNPHHLFMGTTQDNVTDKMRKGRFVTTPGEKNGYAKLTEDQVLAILADKRPQHVIGKDYGISQSNVSIIKRGKTWAHLGEVA